MRYDDIGKKRKTVLNHEGETAYVMTPEMELYTAVVTCAMSDSFYESTDGRVERIAALIRKVDPAFVARLAIYARIRMNLRSIPLFLLVELAGIHNGDSLVGDAIGRTILRADEIMELLSCYQWRNAPAGARKKLGRLSRQVQNGLKTAFNRFDEYQFAKYDRSRLEVTLRDALFLVHPKAKDAAQQAVFDKIVAGTLEVPYTWETRLSALGQMKFSSEEAHAAAVRALWQELIDSDRLGYMALLRNLRNILQAGVSDEHIRKVCSRLSDADAVAKSRQLPFRFLSAYRMISENGSLRAPMVLSALEAAAEASAANIQGFGPDVNVLVAADTSGSMMCPVSSAGSVMYYDIGIMLAMLLKSRCASVVSGVFADRWKVVAMPQNPVLANVMAMRRRVGEVGYSTNGYKVIDWLLDNGVRMDKVMIFTDCQMWNSDPGTWRFGSGSSGASGKAQASSIQKSWAKYKSRFPGARLYLFDLAGYGTSPVAFPCHDVALISGWSDKVFDVLAAIEIGADAIAEINAIEI